MVVVGKDVIIAQPGGKLLSLVLATGAPRWEVAVGEARGATELERVTDIGGTPVLFEDEVCAVAYQGRVGCFDVATGAARWTKDLSSEVGVSVDQRFVFAVDDKGAVSAFNREGGASAWKNDKLGYRRLSTPVSYGRAVAVGDYQGYIHFLSREDGSFLARAATDGSPVISVPPGGRLESDFSNTIWDCDRNRGRINMKPVIALVGRPNVGKSTLFNRLTRSRDALVADLPGLTRDRHYGEGRVGERPFLVIDTGGFEPVAKEGIMSIRWRCRPSRPWPKPTSSSSSSTAARA